MSAWVKRVGLVLLVAVLAAGALAIVKREEIARLLAVNTLFAPDRIVGQLLEHARRVPLGAAGRRRRARPCRRAPITPLPIGAGRLDRGTPDHRSRGAARRAVAHESYHLGTGPDDLRISWSVAKSFLSLLTGILVEEGRIDLSDPVEKYAPGSPPRPMPERRVQDVLQMESGVAFDEDYFDRDSDINRMGRRHRPGRRAGRFHRRPGGPRPGAGRRR